MNKETKPVMRVTYTGVKASGMSDESKPITRYVYVLPTVTAEELRALGKIIEMLGYETTIKQIMTTKQALV